MQSEPTRIKAPRLHVNQSKVIQERARFNILACGRRFGKTILGEHLALKIALGDGKGYPVGWFAPTYKFLSEPMRDLMRILAPATKSASTQEKRIELVNGGVIDFWTLDTPDAGRGRKYKRAIIDEAGIARNLEDAWINAIRPTLTDYKGDAWFLGTPKGRNYFHRLFTLGESEPEWRSWRMGTVHNPYIDPAEVEAARRAMPESAFNQEYMGIPADDGGNPFGLPAIKACISPTLREPSNGEQYVIGVDLAKSVDWTVCVVMDARGNVCAFERWQAPWDVTIRRIQSLASKYNNAQLCVDQTGVGDPIVEQLQRLPYL